MTPVHRKRTVPPAQPGSHGRARWVAVATTLALGAAGLAAAPSANAAPSYVSDPASYVNPFIGSQDEGNTFPGATVPFGMVQLSPDTGHNTGYDYTQDKVRGFSTTHMSGVGCGLDGFVPILPTTSIPDKTDYSSGGYERSFKKADGKKVEDAEPGYYTATLESGTNIDIKAELTATEHTGLQRYTYPSSLGPGGSANVLINAGQSLSSVSHSSVKVVDDDTVETTSTVSGFCQETEPFTVYSVTKFARPFTSSKTWVDDTYSDTKDSASSDQRTGALLTFDTSEDAQVQLQTAISYASMAGARANLAAEATSFDQAKAASHQTWENQLKKVEVDDAASTNDLKVFYSAVYRSFVAPNTGTDVTGDYRGWDGKVHNVADEEGFDTYYQNFSLWDTYRSQQQILALLEPQRSQDMAFSVVLQGEQNGWAPRWGYGPVETNIMTGDPVTPFLVSAYHEGLLSPARAERAYAVLQQNADGVPPSDSPSNGRMGNPTFNTEGYVTHNPGAPHKPGDFDLDHGASATLEYALADATLSTFARDLGHTADADRYALRGQNFRAIWDSESKTFRGRGTDGLFLPANIDEGSVQPFHEGTTAQYQWLVQQDVPGLMKLFGGPSATDGGKQATIDRLDDFFAYDDLMADPDDTIHHEWVTGSYDYYTKSTYNPNNEPDLHSPFIYLWTGQPWKTTDVVRAALRLFTDGPTGVTGNDDLGEMSSWALASSIGIFPIVPGTDVWGLSTPTFEHVKLTLDTSFYTHSSGTLTFNTPGVSDTKHYVQSMTVDGRPVDKAYLSGTDLTSASSIDYVVGSSPSAWATGSDAAPGAIDDVTPPTHVYVADGNQVPAEPGDVLSDVTGAIVRGAGTLSGTIAVSGSDQVSVQGPTSWTADADGGSVQLPVSLKVASDTEPGVYPVTITLSASDGQTASGTIAVAVGQSSWLADVPASEGGFNNKAIGQPTSGSADLANGEFFIRSAMAPGGIGSGVVHTLPSDPRLTYVLHDEGPSSTPTDYDNLTMHGQETDVSDGLAGATAIAFVGTVNNGPVDPVSATITYSDDSTQTIELGFTDWCSSSPQVSGNISVGKAAERWSNGNVQSLACGLWGTKTYDLKPGKSVSTITWPDEEKEHVFAIARDTPPVTAPTVTGTAEVGQTLSVVPGTYDTSDYVESYQWLTGGSVINDATDSSFTVPANLAGANVAVRVTAQRPGLTSTVVSTVSGGTVAPGSIAVVKAGHVKKAHKKNKVRVGKKLAVTKGKYDPADVTVKYRWFSGGDKIKGKKGKKKHYKIRKADKGSKLRVKVKVKKTGYEKTTYKTAKTVKVAKGKIKVKKKAKIKKRHKKNKVRVGKKLKVTKGKYQPKNVKIKYRWFSGGDKIKGKKGKKKHYKIRKADKGSKLRVKVKVKKKGYKKTTYKTTKTVKVKKKK